jgi:hypothetical protein
MTWKTGESLKALPNDRHVNPILNAPLFPLLPSVQFFFAAFSQNQSDPDFICPEKEERPN